MRTLPQSLKAMILGGASAAALTLSAGAAFAQAQTAESEPTARKLEVITVTANRRNESAQDVPVSVTAFSPVQLQAAGIRDTVDLVRFTPGLTGGLNTGTGGAVSYYMRGLGSTEQVATFDAPVATYVDEIYIARQSVNNFSLFDVERVEVLRGPQGTLFGRNTTGGAINVISRKPSTEFGGFLEASLGSYDRLQLRATVDVPFSEKILTKFSGFYLQSDGYVDNTTLKTKFNGEEGYGFKAAARILFTDAITWDISADYTDLDKATIGNGATANDYTSQSGLKQIKCGDNPIDDYIAGKGANCSRIRSGGVTSNLQWDQAWGSINFITGYRSTGQGFAIDFFNGASPRGGYVIGNEIANHQFSQEIKLSGQTDRLTWVAGLFYLKEDNKTRSIDSFALGGGAASPGSLILGSKVLLNEAEVMAIYAQGDIKINEKTKLTLGGRYTDEKKSVETLDANRGSWGAGFIPSPPSLANRATSANMRNFGIPLSQSVSKFTPKAVLSYQVDASKLVYASVTNGFKSGGWNGRDNNAVLSRPFGPEQIWSYELGAKTEWFDGLFRLNATLYYSEIEDLQLLSGFPNPVTGAISFVTNNAGDLTAKGIEFEFAAAPTEYLDVFGTLTFSNGEYSNTTPGPSCVANPTAASCVTDRDIPVRYPDAQYSVGGAYRIPAPALGGEFSLGGAVSYSDDYWTSTSNDTGRVTRPDGRIVRFSDVGPTTVFNANITYRSESRNWEASLDCTNCGETYYYTSSLLGVGYPNDPRRITFRLKYTY